MRISSDYYYYYSQSYATNLLSGTKASADDSDSSNSGSEKVGFPAERRSMTSGEGYAMNLSLNGRMIRHSLQSEQADSVEKSHKVEALKSADVDSMTADEVKETLEEIKSSMDAMPKPAGASGAAAEIDPDSMSEDEMREMLKDIQKQAENAPEMAEEMPPMMGAGMPPMVGGFDPLMMPGDTEESREGTSLTGSVDSPESYIGQIIDRLTEAYGSSDESAADYVEKLKETLTTTFDEQKRRIDDFSSMLFSKLDDWSNQEDTEAETV